jgi:hypothetical protein
MSEPHLLRFKMDEGFHLMVDDIECPHEELGKERPCALWEDEDGTVVSDACAVQHWFHAAGGYAEELGFRLPKGVFWVDVEDPFPVAHSFINDSLEMWPWGTE